ncbi:hypothetical protein HanIR_Chr11g0523281 [Helianthus annuus]|nr:hypothetical protein HanIR_Chr11g0523281 [Helianthus annuus]
MRAWRLTCLYVKEHAPANDLCAHMSCTFLAFIGVREDCSPRSPDLMYGQVKMLSLGGARFVHPCSVIREIILTLPMVLHHAGNNLLLLNRC